MFWKDSMKRIYDYNSKIKLIIILRNPIERAYSHWNMEVQRKREHRTFWDAINKEVNNLGNNSNKSRTFSYLETWILLFTNYKITSTLEKINFFV